MRAGFTLIELVVVIMILGILAAVAAPKLLNMSATASDNGLKQTLAVGILALSHGLDALIELLGGADRGVLAEFEERIRGARGQALLIAAVGIGIAPAIAEELLFRGLIQRQIERQHGALAAITLTSLAFGAIHLDPIQGPAAVVVGLYLGVVAHLATSIRASILCHAVNNLMAVGLTAGGLAPPLPAAASAPIGLGIGAVLLWTVWRWAGAPPAPETTAGAATGPAAGEAAHFPELQRGAGPDDG